MVQQNLNIGPYGPFDQADVFDFSGVGPDGQPNQVNDPDDDGDCIYGPPPNDELGPGPEDGDNGDPSRDGDIQMQVTGEGADQGGGPDDPDDEDKEVYSGDPRDELAPGRYTEDDGGPFADAENYIQGTDQDEDLNGTDVNDWIEGRGGNDTKAGGLGDDHFVFSGDFGSDTITDFGIGKDVLEFQGITEDMLSFTHTDNGVIVHVEGAGASGEIFLLGVNDVSVDDLLFL